MIVKKTIPYEILIRFGFGASHQTVKPGEFSGAHYIEATLIIDDATGECVAPPNIGPAQEVPQDRLAALCGDHAAAIIAGASAMNERISALSEENAALVSECDALRRQVEGTKAA